MDATTHGLLFNLDEHIRQTMLRQKTSMDDEDANYGDGFASACAWFRQQLEPILKPEDARPVIKQAELMRHVQAFMEEKGEFKTMLFEILPGGDCEANMYKKTVEQTIFTYMIGFMTERMKEDIDER